jgi:hypothetical protein
VRVLAQLGGEERVLAQHGGVEERFVAQLGRLLEERVVAQQRQRVVVALARRRRLLARPRSSLYTGRGPQGSRPLSFPGRPSAITGAWAILTSRTLAR